MNSEQTLDYVNKRVEQMSQSGSGTIEATCRQYRSDEVTTLVGKMKTITPSAIRKLIAKNPQAWCAYDLLADEADKQKLREVAQRWINIKNIAMAMLETGLAAITDSAVFRGHDEIEYELEATLDRNYIEDAIKHYESGKRTYCRKRFGGDVNTVKIKTNSRPGSASRRYRGGRGE